ncbi:histone H2B.3-like [Ananas comosus]|uniref:Histone H2B.3-like n=1 Tax=Ananas comosus TaxID=4615 RepID=A0A6P5GXI1_ANACO|nr:histone H2B.3-like [Ananas comosus]
MAPRKPRKMVGAVVKTTAKVVEETVKVAPVVGVGDGDGDGDGAEEVEEAAVPLKDSKVVQVVVVGGEKGDGEVPEANDGRDEPEKRKEAMEVDENQAPKETGEESKRRGRGRPLKERGPETPTEKSEIPPANKKKEKDRGGRSEGEAEEGKGRRRRRRKRRFGSAGDAGSGGVGGYKRYVFRVLKQVHPELGASARAMQVLDMMMADMFQRLAEEAARLSKYTGRATLTSREIQNAVRLVLPGELGRHAVSEGTKAVTNYMASQSS